MNYNNLKEALLAFPEQTCYYCKKPFDPFHARLTIMDDGEVHVDCMECGTKKVEADHPVKKAVRNQLSRWDINSKNDLDKAVASISTTLLIGILMYTLGHLGGMVTGVQLMKDLSEAMVNGKTLGK